MSGVTTHVLDTSRGRPAAGVPVLLEARSGREDWQDRGRGVTDADGRLSKLFEGPLTAGLYRLTFDTAAYFQAQGVAAFYPVVTVVFEVTSPSQHHHVPLLLSPFGYSTYRGS